MLVYQKGNIWSTACECIVVPVNTVGVAGAGMALEFSQRYSDLATDYRRLCKSGNLRIGSIRHLSSVEDGSYILLFPTKEHYKNPSKIEWIEAGLQVWAKQVNEGCPYKSIAFPLLGAGLGGLPTDLVRSTMEKHLNKVDDLYIEIWERINP